MENFKVTNFVIESMPGKTFAGFTSGDTWNGWACPYFERHEAENILRYSENNGYSWHYDAQEDAFIVRSVEDAADWEPEVFKSTLITVNGQETPTYPIGAYSWIWEVKVN